MPFFQPEKKHILASGIFKKTLREWQGSNCTINSSNLMYPIFLIDDDNAIQPISSMPGVMRFGLNQLKNHLEPLVKKGLKSVLIFGVIEKLEKDEFGSQADADNNPVMRAIPKIADWFPELIIACDLCLCPYTSHGHCGILNKDGSINNAKSLERLAHVALAYARAGAHIIAPSDMMDGRIGAIKQIFLENGLGNKVSVLSYAAKFASSFYGPFRDAAKSAPAFGDRKCYQLPPNSEGLALRAVARDVEEGADMLMVKPALAYLDIVQKTKSKFPEYPMFVYQVSGEYAMIYYAAKAGVIDLKVVLQEVLLSMRRAGADVIITYFTPEILNWLSTQSKL